MKQQNQKSNNGTVWTAVGAIFFISLLLGFIVWSTVNILNHSVHTAGVSADTSLTERVMVDIDDPYLIRDGNSMVLIEPTPTSGVIFYRAIDPDTDGDWTADRGGTGMIDVHTNKLHIFSEFDLSENSVLKRKDLRAYEHTLKY